MNRPKIGKDSKYKLPFEEKMKHHSLNLKVLKKDTEKAKFQLPKSKRTKTQYQHYPEDDTSRTKHLQTESSQKGLPHQFNTLSIRQLPRKQSSHSWLPPQNRSIEDVYQENNLLKKKVNEYKEEAVSLKTKVNFYKKENEKLSKEMFLENEYYYEGFDLAEKSAGNKFKIQNKNGFHPVSYMITGIKHRYELLKQKYDKKCQQVSDMIKKTEICQIEQLVRHVNILQNENKALIAEIQILKSFDHGASISDGNCFRSSKFQGQQLRNSEFQPPLTQQLATEPLHNEIQKLNVKNQVISAKLQNCQSELKEKIFTIEKIEKALRISDNEVYQKKKEVNRMTKYRKITEEKYYFMEKENSKIKKECEEKIAKVKNDCQKLFEIEKNIFTTEMHTKDETVIKLQKQVSYLSTLLKYWRPLEGEKNQQGTAVFRLSPRHSNVQDSGMNLRSSSKGSKSSTLLMNRKRNKSIMNSYNGVSASKVEEFRLNLKQGEEQFENTSVFGSQIEVESAEQQEADDRKPKTSRHKHSQSGFKVRKISPREIENLKNPIKYRCYHKRLTMNQIKQLFQFHEGSSPAFTQSRAGRRNSTWDRKYISMRQIKDILLSQPFILTEEESNKLSRYIVEDISSEHVYCDEQNEIQRQIVKSIIKAFLGDYQLPDIEKCKEEWEFTIKKYGKNMGLALESLAQQGTISPHKLFELMESLGIEVSDNLKTEIITRLYARDMQNGNRNIDSLHYRPMFGEDFL